MVTANILNRTLFISAAEYGSAVVITVDGIEYVVTAIGADMGGAVKGFKDEMGSSKKPSDKDANFS